MQFSLHVLHTDVHACVERRVITQKLKCSARYSYRSKMTMHTLKGHKSEIVALDAAAADAEIATLTIRECDALC